MHRCHSCGALNRVAAHNPGGQPVCGRCKQTLDTSGAPQEVTAEQLSRAIASSQVPVLVDFWAPWCGPCRAAAPVLDQVARSNAGALVTLKVNTDQEPAAASAHGIRGIPTFALYLHGSELARQSGAMPRNAFEQWVQSHVGAAQSGTYP